MFPGRKEGATSSLETADPVKNHRYLPLASGDSMLRYSQNVAGMWLKYGAKV
jgi:hypothetical protein